MNIFSLIATDLPYFVLHILFPQTLKWLFFLAVIWVPALLFEFTWVYWTRYKRYDWIRKQEKVLLEIKLPLETTKSPLAMELVLLALYQTGGEGTPVNRYWEGKVRPYFSLELASIDGEIHFYIWTFKSQRNVIETNIYAQYPGVEIHEVEDYVNKMPYDANKHDLSGCRFEATGPDPLPIKTYIDYGLDRDPKEEFKIDPIAPLIEFMGSLKKGHQAWVQIIVRAHTQEKNPFNEKYPDKWKDEAKELIKKIVEESAVEDEEGNKTPNSVKLTEGQKDRITAIERSVSKYAFDTGIRILYIAPKDIFDKGMGGGLMGSFKQFNAPHLNGFKPEGGMSVDYKWQDWKGKMVAQRKVSHFKAYRDRGYFHYPYKVKNTVLNTEELATMYHFPGSAVKTPTLKRIPSKRADAPSNLPV